MRLIIKQSSWSARKIEYKPDEIEKEYDIHFNEKYVVKSRKVSYVKDGKKVEEEREIFSFDIIEINDRSIKIHTYQSFSNNDNGKINLMSKKRDFIITDEKPLKLITPTMDFGEIFTITLIK